MPARVENGVAGRPEVEDGPPVTDSASPPPASTGPAPPALAQFFERGSALSLALRGHPYDFVETYEILRAAYGYSSASVNLGLWRAALAPSREALDPGQRLVRHLVDHAAARAPHDILDVGSGLGQAAVDLARWFESARVRGANINERQLSYANALAHSHGVSNRVQHVRADACGGLRAAFGAEAFDLALAVECVGHFASPASFLGDLRDVLRVGGALACCMNVARGPLPLSLRTVLSATYGFVPRPLAEWAELCRAAGLEVSAEGDLTEPVLVEGIAQVRARLATDEVRAAVPFGARALLRAQLEVARSAVERGALGYAYLVARRAR